MESREQYNKLGHSEHQKHAFKHERAGANVDDGGFGGRVQAFGPSRYQVGVVHVAIK